MTLLTNTAHLCLRRSRVVLFGNRSINWTSLRDFLVFLCQKTPLPGSGQHTAVSNEWSG